MKEKNEESVLEMNIKKGNNEEKGKKDDCR
jgi:hypothetical protein